MKWIWLEKMCILVLPIHVRILFMHEVKWNWYEWKKISVHDDISVTKELLIRFIYFYRSKIKMFIITQWDSHIHRCRQFYCFIIMLSFPIVRFHPRAYDASLKWNTSTPSPYLKPICVILMVSSLERKLRQRNWIMIAIISLFDRLKGCMQAGALRRFPGLPVYS